MSKPKLLNAYIRGSCDTIVTANTGYAEVFDWYGDCPDAEDTGYFVSIENGGIVIANSTSTVKGVTVDAPGFATSWSSVKERTLKETYACVVSSGSAKVKDDGTCVVGGKCTPNDQGIATPSTDEYGYEVLSRIDSTHVMIYMEPQVDTIQKIEKEALSMRVDGAVLFIE